MDASIDDYGSGRMTVTESRIEEIRQRVEALGLPKPDSPIEYITDNNKGLFKTRPEVIPGSVSVSSSGTVTLTDWKNVVVFEVRTPPAVWSSPPRASSPRPPRLSSAFQADGTHPTVFWRSPPPAKGRKSGLDRERVTK